MDFRKMLKLSAQISNKTGKLRLFLILDMIWCGIVYQAGYMDYALFEMHAMNHHQRSTVLTRGKNNRYVSTLNNRKGWCFFEDKVLFNKTFSDFIGRSWIDLSSTDFDSFEKFVREHVRFIAKAPEGTHGSQVELISLSHGEDLDTDQITSLYDSLRRKGLTLCEEVVGQRKELSVIYPHSVNTIRIVTIVTQEKPHIIAAYFRIGNNGRIVDNFNSGGMVTPVDISDGRITKPAVDKAGNVYEAHPVTGTRIIGAKIPYWQECLETVRKAAVINQDVRYVGWDIAVTPNGPVIIEGNHFPGHDIYCLPAQTPDRVGILPYFEAVIPLKSLKQKRLANMHFNRVR